MYILSVQRPICMHGRSHQNNHNKKIRIPKGLFPWDSLICRIPVYHFYWSKKGKVTFPHNNQICSCRVFYFSLAKQRVLVWRKKLKISRSNWIVNDFQLHTQQWHNKTWAEKNQCNVKTCRNYNCYIYIKLRFHCYRKDSPN